MKIRLPIPIFHGDRVYDSVEIDRPRTIVFSDTKRIADTGDTFSAIHVFLSGSIEALYSDDETFSERAQIKSIVRSMPYRSAECCVIKAMLLHDPDDGVEGVYTCPRCGAQSISQIVTEDGVVTFDTRDYISNLRLGVMEDPERYIQYKFLEDVKVLNAETGEPLASVSSMKMEHPTLAHCITAYQRVGNADDIRRQYAIYVEAIVDVNGKPVDATWKNRYGLLIFDNIRNRQDWVNITNLVNEYGLDKRVTKNCRQCGKEWRTIVNTSNFFAFEPPSQ